MLYRLIFFIVIACNAGQSSYDIYRSPCRRYGVFQLHSRNNKFTAKYMAAIYAKLLATCARACLQTANCKYINYKKAAPENELNCETFSSDSNVNALQADVGWNSYKPVTQNVIPACMTKDDTPPCNPGYRCEELCTPGGPRFTCVDINECLSLPCKNGGTCNNQINKYTCTCVAGYTGVNCESEINECASNPCQNGGTCIDFVNRFQCTCVPGYTGSQCQTDINECESNPCVHGSCSDRLNYYSCSCSGGWTGTRCNYDINECASNPCVNGNCNNRANHYTCSCNILWGGTRCDKFLGIGKKK